MSAQCEKFEQGHKPGLGARGRRGGWGEGGGRGGQGEGGGRGLRSGTAFGSCCFLAAVYWAVF